MAVKCPYCNEDFKNLAGLSGHITLKHGEIQQKAVKSATPTPQPQADPSPAVQPIRIKGIRAVIREQIETMFELQLLKFLQQPFNAQQFEALSKIVAGTEQTPKQAIDDFKRDFEKQQKALQESFADGIKEGISQGGEGGGGGRIRKHL